MSIIGLELASVSKRYKGEMVLDDINLTVPGGGTLVLFGPSGSGKSVLLRLIAGVIDADVGEVIINGRNVTSVDPEERGVGMAFQNFALYPHLSARKNIASSLEVTEPSASKLEAAVLAVATLLKIDHVLEHAPKELSNGQKQRTALARALVGNPSLLLLDDPLRNVDAKLRFEMRLELPALLSRQGNTVVYVTQDYKEAMALGDQIAVLVDGKIQQIDTPETIYYQPANIEIARQFGDPTINLLDVVPEHDGDRQFVMLSNRRLELPATTPDVTGQELVIGFRPESLSLVAEGTPGAIPVNIEAVTPLNEKIVTLLSTDGQREILSSRPATSDGLAAGRAAITIDPSTVHLFNRTTGNRIDSVQHTEPARQVSP